MAVALPGATLRRRMLVPFKGGPRSLFSNPRWVWISNRTIVVTNKVIGHRRVIDVLRSARAIDDICCRPLAPGIPSRSLEQSR